MNINNASPHTYVNTEIANSTADMPKNEAKNNTPFSFTPSAQTSFANNVSQPDVTSLLDTLKQLLSSFSQSSSVNNTVSEPAENTQETYADGLRGLSVSNMSTKREPSLSRIRVHNELGTSEPKSDAISHLGFSESNGEQSFRLQSGLRMPRGNGGDDHSRVEAFTQDNWAPADNKTHSFSANYLVGRIDDDMAVFQIKESGAAFPAITARLREDPSRGFRLDIVGTHPDEGNNKRIPLGSYTIGAKDGVSPPEPKQFSINASDDGETWKIAVKQGGKDLFARLDPNEEVRSIDSTDVSKELTGKHLNSPADDSVAFRWGLYSNSPQPTGFDSTSTVNNIRISSTDGKID